MWGFLEEGNSVLYCYGIMTVVEGRLQMEGGDGVHWVEKEGELVIGEDLGEENAVGQSMAGTGACALRRTGQLSMRNGG
ncbi:hypothetical protein L1049_015037 [Liquidambar formosana]|uniref:Uncharacterized protein n=1 Tax=Liquidambar formosana TaxID=63359 RepID=A0AAP0S3R7_LIQFO